MLAAIEAGGTKFVLAVGHASGAIAARHEIPTRTPEETLAEAASWIQSQGPVAAIGIAAFGPAQLDRNAADWGHILGTPKPGWTHCDIAGYFANRFEIPVGFDTDVNGAALGEYRLGAGRMTGGMAYITVGTGIGGGIIVNGEIVHGVSHPEMGHFYPRREASDRAFAGVCPYHGDCLEGLASGPAILARWGRNLSDLPDDHEAHGLVAGYLAQLCHTLFAFCAVECIVMGGGVMKTPGLLERVHASAQSLDNRYLPGGARHQIVSPKLGNDAGIVGALRLANASRNLSP
ncbi:ROK family protein [Aurantiacibacter marinus]|uniref:fructokinase n=1 Tax=Aurantiacibacter marinus TaxID=874156 RepID=A0A0H0XVR6_9SPHN|nr:ROK family protein [Aurantiacibacter marinus]KLI64365.1 fructokinase [Aurantiacibacter marinus]